MAKSRLVIWAALLLVALAGAGLGSRLSRSGSLQHAQSRAETQAPPLQLSWGKLRAFARCGEAWELVYQPAHGAWVVRVLVPDTAPPHPPRLEVVAWLPGGHLSLAAASFLAGDGSAEGVAERPARRDWWFSQRVVYGALPVAKPERCGRPWPSVPTELALFFGLCCAGALARRIRLTAADPKLRRVVLVSAAAMLAAVPGATRLAGPLFSPGVRPFITLLVLATAGAVGLGVVGACAYLFPLAAARPCGWVWAVGGVVGWLGGVWLAPLWAQALGALPARWVWLLGGGVLVGYVVDLAGAGVRILLSPLRWLTSGIALLLALTALLAGQDGWLPVVAACLVAVLPPGQGFPFATVATSALLAGSWWVSYGVLGPLRDALVLALALVGLGSACALRRREG